MQKTKIVKTSARVLLGGFIILASFLFIPVVKAEEPGLNEAEQAPEIRFDASGFGTIIFDANSDRVPVTVADVGLDDIKVISQDGNRLKVSFNIINYGHRIQSNIKYGIFLIPKKDSLEIIQNKTGEKVYLEEISLIEHEGINRTVEYTAPSYLAGEYLLSIGLYVSSGLPLESQIITEPVLLEGDNQFLEILPSSCHLTIEGGAVNKKYSMTEGISLDSSKEKLVGSCNVINHFDKQVKFTPTFETYRRSVYGKKIEESQSDLGEFQFNPGEEKVISFTLPTNMESQAYDTRIMLKNEGKSISNSVAMHYVLKGVSATIQNITFDKSSYLKGETAGVNLFWTGSADQFPDSRVEGTVVKDLTVDLFIKDKENNQICGQATQKLDSMIPSVSIPTLIIMDCDSPVILSTIKDKEGKILAQKESQISDRESSNANRRVIALTILVSLFVIILVIAIVLNIKRKK